MRLTITPSCCEDMRRTKAVGITVDGDGNPSWALMLCAPSDRIDHFTIEDYDVPAPRNCPFCPTPIPGIERRPGVTSPINTNEEDWCGACELRNRACGCLPPWAAWQPVGGDGIDVDSIWRVDTFHSLGDRIRYRDIGDEDLAELVRRRDELWAGMTESDKRLLDETQKRRR